MKTNATSLCTTLLLAASLVAQADSPQPSPGLRPPSPSPASEGQTKPASAEFERMKTLVGSWTGKTDMGQGLMDIRLDYRLIAGGTVLEERSFAGTPQEMVTMYYDQGGKLAMTHYCVLGNRPGMKFKSSDAKTIHFDFDATCGINPRKESHMHALSITFDDADTITSSCQAIMDGRELPEKPTTLKRVKS